MNCAYCGVAPAIHKDHIVSKALRRRHPGWENVTVPACGPCNWRKGTRRLVPVGYDMSNLPGVKPWRHWDGSIEGLRETIR
jgi:5-methylcytosine-specific restriction endonuclease McrA